MTENENRFKVMDRVLFAHSSTKSFGMIGRKDKARGHILHCLYRIKLKHQRWGEYGLGQITLYYNLHTNVMGGI